MSTITLKIEKGIDNMHDPHKLGKITDFRDQSVKVLTEAENVDIDSVGVARLRSGRVSRLAATYPHSFWVHPQDEATAYFVAGGVLKRFNTDYTATTVLTLASDVACGYEVINGQAIVSDGRVIGWLEGATFTAFSGSTESVFYATMYPGRYLAFWKGILWVANYDLLGFSLPYNIETRDTRFDTIPMDGGIRMLAAVEDGLWVATEKHVSFINGSGPDDLQFNHVSDAVPADGCFSVGFESADKGTMRVVRWASPEGFCTGRAGGAYANLSPDTRLPSGSTGICEEKEHNGMTQYIAVIRDATDGNIYSADELFVNTHMV